MRPLDLLVADPAGERLLTIEPAIGGGGPRNIGLRLDFDGEPADIIRSSGALGAGQAASPSLHVGGARDQRGLTIFTQTSVGSIEVREGQASSSLRSGEVDWREPRE